METRTTILNFQPGTSIPVVHVSQYDVGVLLRFILYDGSEMAEIEGGSGTSVVIAATRPSGTGFSVPCSIIASNIVEVATTEAMTKEFGIMDAEIRYTNDGDSVGTGNFKFLVEAASHADYIIDEDHAEWVRIAQEVASDRASAQSAKQSAQQSATRAETAANRVAGEVDKAIAAAATATSAKDAAVTAKSAAETAAENAEASAINAGDAVDAAQLAADDAEAYAVGTRGGEPVISTDPTYHNNSKYYAELGGAANLANVFSTSTAYAVDDYVLYNSKLWRFTTAHAAGAWNASHVSEVKAMDEVSDLKGDLSEIEPGLLSYEVKEALLACFRHIAFLDEDEDYYHNLELALGVDAYEVQTYPGTISLFQGTPSFLSGSNTDGILLSNGPNGIRNRRTFGMITGEHKLEVINPIETDAYPIPVPINMKSAHISITPSPMQILGQLWRYDSTENVYKFVELSSWAQDVLMTFDSVDKLYLIINTRASSADIDFVDEPSSLTVLFAREGYPKISAEVTDTVTRVYDDWSLDDLKNVLTVKYMKSEQEYEIVTDYTLSGTLTNAESTITITYKGITGTVNVDVTIGRPLLSSDIISSIGYSNFSVDSNGNISSTETISFSILEFNQSIKHIRFTPSFNDSNNRKDVPLWTAFNKNSVNTFICNDLNSVYLFTADSGKYTAAKDNTLGTIILNNYSGFTATGRKDVILEDDKLTIVEVSDPTANITLASANAIGFWSDGNKNSCPKNVRVYDD